MEITKIELSLCNKKREKASATITLNRQLLIKNVKIIQTEKRLCISFPQIKNKEIIVLLNSKTRDYFEQTILAEYNNLLEKEELKC